jgi:hypothetical protein
MSESVRRSSPVVATLRSYVPVSGGQRSEDLEQLRREGAHVRRVVVPFAARRVAFAG